MLGNLKNVNILLDTYIPNARLKDGCFQCLRSQPTLKPSGEVKGMLKSKEKKKQDQLRRIVKKSRKRVNSKFSNVEWLNYRFRCSLKAYVLIVEKRPPNDIVFEMANILDYVYENRSRIQELQAVGERTREEWERFELNYLGYPPSLEDGKKFCAAWNCFSQIKAIGRKSYCSERCRNEQKMATKRLKDNGTLLPVAVYKSLRQEYAVKKQGSSEFSTGTIETYGFNNPYELRTIGAKRKKIRPTIDSKNNSHKVSVRLNDKVNPNRPNVFTVNIATGKKQVLNAKSYGDHYR